MMVHGSHWTSKPKSAMLCSFELICAFRLNLLYTLPFNGHQVLTLLHVRIEPPSGECKERNEDRCFTIIGCYIITIMSVKVVRIFVRLLSSNIRNRNSQMQLVSHFLRNIEASFLSKFSLQFSLKTFSLVLHLSQFIIILDFSQCS